MDRFFTKDNVPLIPLHLPTDLIIGGTTSSASRLSSFRSKLKSLTKKSKISPSSLGVGVAVNICQEDLPKVRRVLGTNLTLTGKIEAPGVPTNQFSCPT